MAEDNGMVPLVTDEALGIDPATVDLETVRKDIESLISFWRKGYKEALDPVHYLVWDGRPFQGYRRNGRLTWHELVWSRWFPHLEPQVTFGTGKGGLARWGSVSFTADFLDRDSKTVYEVDGPSHTPAERKERDARKDAFLATLGFNVVRVDNWIIEKWAEEALLYNAQRNLKLVDFDRTQHHRALPLTEMVQQYYKSVEEQEAWSKQALSMDTSQAARNFTVEDLAVLEDFLPTTPALQRRIDAQERREAKRTAKLRAAHSQP